MQNTLIKGGLVVNEGQRMDADILVQDCDIVQMAPHGSIHTDASLTEEVDASGCIVLPGVIDSHVHFREPGLTHKACISTESAAAAAGGVTTYFDMPNCQPQTTTLEALAGKCQRAASTSVVNYAFFFGATNDNASLFAHLDVSSVPGIKLFMGSSTGNMLVDRREDLLRVFSMAARMGLPVMVHCEDSSIINDNMSQARELWGDDPSVEHHPEIRSREACVASTQLAIALARQAGARLHVAHISTADELELIASNGHSSVGADTSVSAELCVGHLLFSDKDYARLGTLIKVNPAIKSQTDCDALRHALMQQYPLTIGTDHAPHLLSEKQGGCLRAASGMPMVQFSLPAMLELVEQGVLTIERLVQLMCHAPATIFGVRRRGYLRPGFHADLVIVRKKDWTLTPEQILSRCAWSPLTGQRFHWRVERTMCNGVTVYADGRLTGQRAGEAVQFR